ncbi:MAG: methyltransferase domain-containing protein [Clostridiales bacterium]|nr:methyltransferase domain-containing protein [Eubacteriales bacterium]MDH7566189.1 methyltransferase domain-containing protein [Clostridiales bacterium]
MDSEVKEKIASSWNSHAKEYDLQYAHGLKSSREEEEWKRALEKIIGADRKKVLDVGTGTGFIAILLAEMGHVVKGVDISEGMMEEARTKAEGKNLSIRFEYGDAENLGEPDDAYDVVINRHLLWTLQYPEKAVREWIRVLKPGGKLVVIDGDWFYTKPSYFLSVFLGKLLVALTEFRNPWNNKSDYDRTLKKKLPMIRSKNARNAVSLVEKCGLKNIRATGLEEVERAEKSAMPLKQKLLNPHKRMVIEGVKP